MATSRFQDRVAVVTGGASGIGRATAERLAAEGAELLVLDRNLAGAEQTVALIESRGGRGRALALDLTDEASIGEAAEQVLQLQPAVHALVHCAGLLHIGGRPNNPFVETGLAGWDSLFEVNIRGAAALTHALLPALVAGRASIVTIASDGVYRARASRWIYDATKASVLSFTRSLAAALATDGVRVNCVAPGGTITEMHLGDQVEEETARAALQAGGIGNLLGRFAEPREIAASIAFLCSEDASFITGTTLAVDGGGAASRL
jgi:NAD(P)-dependent dehydrogenase (short-subunit alcohol dehydrogenase family)